MHSIVWLRLTEDRGWSMRISIAAGILFAVWSQSALPCSCMELSPQEKVDRATYIFRARLTRTTLVAVPSHLLGSSGVDSRYPGELVKAEFENLETLKGGPSVLEALYTEQSFASCGVPMVIGVEYLFLTDEFGFVSSCGGTATNGGISFARSREWQDLIRLLGSRDY